MAATPGQDSLNEPFDDLFDSVEDLIKRVAEIDSPEIQKIRAKARVALMVAKSAAQDGAMHLGRQARRAADTTDGYLREYPWYVLGLGTLVGFGVGMLVATSRE
ncbi:MAG TPA: hypothetical protein VHY75_04420 [Steroidobacteraceae bacterium]|jgi:ElaB/YqjD/DUF883 family membrane-anchored ribosome-binding protein|nr:hypothetical protein [Steroidobacteraceae bacterium]